MLQPKRAVVIKIEVGADSMESAGDLVEHFLGNMRDGSDSTICGGVDAGGHYAIERRPEMTHDHYRQQLDAFLKWQREQK